MTTRCSRGKLDERRHVGRPTQQLRARVGQVARQAGEPLALALQRPRIRNNDALGRYRVQLERAPDVLKQDDGSAARSVRLEEVRQFACGLAQLEFVHLVSDGDYLLQECLVRAAGGIFARVLHEQNGEAGAPRVGLFAQHTPHALDHLSPLATRGDDHREVGGRNVHSFVKDFRGHDRLELPFGEVKAIRAGAGDGVVVIERGITRRGYTTSFLVGTEQTMPHLVIRVQMFGELIWRVLDLNSPQLGRPACATVIDVVDGAASVGFIVFSRP